MNISAFGVVHKSYKKVHPKLVASLKGVGNPPKTHTMDERIRHNYAMFRSTSGTRSGKDPRKRRWFNSDLESRQAKDWSQAMVTAAGNRSKKKRVLP